MNVVTAKYTNAEESGIVVNLGMDDQVDFPVNEDNYHYLDFLKSGVTPDPFEDLAGARARRKQEVNEFVGRHIRTRLGQPEQSNLHRLASQHILKQVNGTITTEEESLLADLVEVGEWVDACLIAGRAVKDVIDVSQAPDSVANPTMPVDPVSLPALQALL